MTYHLPNICSTAKRVSVAVIVILCLVLTACGGQSPVPTVAQTEPAPENLPTTVSLTPPPWREASQPITLDNVAAMELLGVLTVPEGSGTVFGYTLSPDNTQLAALNEGWLLAWDLVSGDALYQTTRQDEIQLFYSPTKETLYGLTASGGVYLYNSATGNEIDSRPAPITFSETGFSGAYDYHQDSASLALGLEDGDIIVWDLIEGEEPQRLTHTDTASRVIDLDFSSNGESLAAVYGVEQNYRISLWNWREGTRMLDVASPPSENRAVSEIAFSHDGRYLSGLALDTIITWDASTGEILHSVPDALRGDSLLFRFIPDTSLLLVGGVESNILLLDVDQGVTIATLPNTGGNPQSIAPIGAAVSPDVQMMLTTKLDEPVALWNLSNLANGNIARNAQPFGSPSIFDVLWTEDSFAVLMIDARGPVEVWGIP